MRDAAGELAAKVLEDGYEVLVRVALMKKHRLTRGHGDFQLCDEGGALRGRRREVAEIIQPAFADRNDPGLSQQFIQFFAPRRIESRGMVRVHARGAPKPGRM